MNKGLLTGLDIGGRILVLVHCAFIISPGTRILLQKPLVVSQFGSEATVTDVGVLAVE